MKLYIVRHGESENNALKTFQDGSSHLSQKGKNQAQFLARRIEKLPNIDTVICSPYIRTRETLDQILKLREFHEVIFSELAQEIERPTEFLDEVIEGPATKDKIKLMRENKADPAWHLSDEENFTDFKKRTIKLIEYIESFDEKDILLVAHGLLAKIIVGVMLFGENLTADEHTRLEKFLLTKNTGITECRKKGGAWQLLTWNDHAHLG